ncbi:MAG: hypothetical protein C9356_15010 [Oleiphilus sp.]|nr:MAG: hypothetical protein C9356_15010 [Oleiphilus sp.]
MNMNTTSQITKRERMRLNIQQQNVERQRLAERLEIGMTLCNRDGTSWAILLADASQSGQFRYQVFDAKGFAYHSTHPSLRQAFDDAFTSGFRILDHGALDRLAATETWRKGMAFQAIRDDYNAGRISWDTMVQRAKAIE